MQTSANDSNELIDVATLRAAVPWWPYSTHGTYRLIRAGKLGAVVIGRRRFVTRALLAQAIATHTVLAQVQP